MMSLLLQKNRGDAEFARGIGATKPGSVLTAQNRIVPRRQLQPVRDPLGRLRWRQSRGVRVSGCSGWELTAESDALGRPVGYLDLLEEVSALGGHI